MKPVAHGLVAALLLRLALAAAAGPAAPYEVTIDNFRFQPATLVVPLGATVTWINRDDVPHTVRSTDKKRFRSPALDTDDKFSVTFSVRGTNEYFCTMHAHMTGQVIVR